MTAIARRTTRLVCDECGYELNDPDEDYGFGDTLAWLRHLADEDGWELDGPDGDICDECLARR